MKSIFLIIYLCFSCTTSYKKSQLPVFQQIIGNWQSSCKKIPIDKFNIYSVQKSFFISSEKWEEFLVYYGDTDCQKILAETKIIYEYAITSSSNADSNGFVNGFSELGATVPSPPKPPLPERHSRTYFVDLKPQDFILRVEEDDKLDEFEDYIAQSLKLTDHPLEEKTWISFKDTIGSESPFGQTFLTAFTIKDDLLAIGGRRNDYRTKQAMRSLDFDEQYIKK